MTCILSIRDVLNKAGVSAVDDEGGDLSGALAESLANNGCYTATEQFTGTLRTLFVTANPETANLHARGLAKAEFSLKCVQPIQTVLETIMPRCIGTSGEGIDFSYAAERLALFGLRAK
jgi:hypothetical protein